VWIHCSCSLLVREVKTTSGTAGVEKAYPEQDDFSIG
jgi:hypothetical protein